MSEVKFPVPIIDYIENDTSLHRMRKFISNLSRINFIVVVF